MAGATRTTSQGTLDSMVAPPPLQNYNLPMAAPKYQSPNNFGAGQDFNQAFQGAPDWVQQFIQQRAGGDTGMYVSDVYNQFQPQLYNAQQQYGQSFMDPSFARKGNVDYSQYNPFADQGFQQNIGGFQVGYNPFQGLTGAQQGLDYLGHYLGNQKAVRQGANSGQQGDVNFFNRYGAQQDPTGLQFNYSKDSANMAFAGAQSEYDQLLALQNQWGY